MKLTYEEFLARKVATAPCHGIDIDPRSLNPALKPFTRDIVRWAVRGAHRGIFASFGLHKTATQLEIMRVIGEQDPCMRLIVMPLGVRQEFIREARERFAGDHAVQVKFIRRIEEADDERTVYLTNYESVRDGILDVAPFDAVSLDEASVLRGRGNKTFGEFTFNLFRETSWKFVATATPSPNEHQELLSYSAFLEVCDIGQARTRFFKRNSTKADQLTLHPHKEREFWLWMASWAIFLDRPSDLGYSDEGYRLPEMDIHWHELPSDHSLAGREKTGQGRLIKNAAIGLPAASREKQDSIDARVAKLIELRAIDPAAHRLVWHDLENERKALERAIPELVTVYGNQDLDEREQSVIDFSDGKIAELAGKPSMLGSGCNFQRHCAWSIFLGVGWKFNDFIQAVFRVQRFGQTRKVRLDLIYTEAERDVRRALEHKWEQDKVLRARMSEIIREYGLAAGALDRELSRSTTVERTEIRGANHLVVNNDSVYETRATAADSVHLILTSIPFATQYEYTPSYLDFGHTDDNEHFFSQMDYLTPELLRVLQPGRICAVHVKDRIVHSGQTGLGFQTVYRFSDATCDHFEKHGFSFLGRKTIVTDVVRENGQTYRLGWTEQCKDGSRMGAGLPEYLLIFRKPPTSHSNGYADVPVVKDKADYTRSRWQIDAHGFMRVAGDRLLTAEDLKGQPWGVIYRLFRQVSRNKVYDFENHVALCQSLEEAGRLPVDFMLMPPQSWHEDVWTDVTRMRTLNGAQSAAGREGHLCPLQFDIADRAITQYTMPGETVLDPFGGLMTVPYCAVKLKRRGIGIELNPRYALDGARFCEMAESEVAAPSLFEFLEHTAEETVGASA